MARLSEMLSEYMGGGINARALTKILLLTDPTDPKKFKTVCGSIGLRDSEKVESIRSQVTLAKP